MKTKTKVKAGAFIGNHNEPQVRDGAPGLKVQTNVKAGVEIVPAANQTRSRLRC